MRPKSSPLPGEDGVLPGGIAVCCHKQQTQLWVMRRPEVLLWLCRCASLSSGTDHPMALAQTENSGGTEMLLPV